MKKKNIFLKSVLSMVISLSIFLGSIPISFAQESQMNNEPKGHVIVSVEKFTLGLGYIKDPVKVPFYEGDNNADILTRLLGYGNYKNMGDIESSFYLSKVKDNDTRTPNVPQYILDKCGEIGEREEANWLGEFDYTFMSGWMYVVNNSFPNVGASGCIPKDGDVIRWQFTTYGYGADIGGDGFGAGEPFVKIANKDSLTREVAEINSAPNKAELLDKKEVKDAYDNAYKVLEVVDIAQSKVDVALKELKEALK
ncbi:DUF4430 domain-containing protein [Clostridium sp. CCUG 7971]|uniref:DUF4430 domain-containing protein n=1 Tax=Clostridium sp. CCUG 7971 TaxID=2811414 RepID=UPI001ABA8375|nr:DUF4430 domain-containing protein [Clostridium sp. CCUG 7971]